MTEQIFDGAGETFEFQYQQLLMADLLLSLHVLFIAFVVFGLVLVIFGGLRDWGWVRNPYFRLCHLGAIGFVVIQSWLNLPCPLTVWENQYRAEAGAIEYSGSFIAHWLSALIYYEAPPWVFMLTYSLFGLMTLLTIFWIRPRPMG